MPQRRARLLPLFAIGLAGTVAVSGCARKTKLPPGVRATDVPVEQATPEYWLDQPAVVHVPARDFDRLWAACQAVARGYRFQVDRLDYRLGLMTTYPSIAPQFFEVWHPDNSNLYDVTAATLDTYRRTIRFEIERLDDGTYDLVPKVLIERKDVVPKRVTSVLRFREALNPNQQTGNITADVPNVPSVFWYPTGRDHNLERRLARSVLDNLY